MKDDVIEKIGDFVARIVECGIKIGTIQTLSTLNVIPEVISKNQTEKKYSRKLVELWRKKKWITAYPSHNGNRNTVYFLVSELEKARAMTDVKNVLIDYDIKELSKKNKENHASIHTPI
jgi:plasmid replication initiation protein